MHFVLHPMNIYVLSICKNDKLGLLSKNEGNGKFNTSIYRYVLKKAIFGKQKKVYIPIIMLKF